MIAAFWSSDMLDLVSLMFVLTAHRLSIGLKVRGVCWLTRSRNTEAIEPAVGTFGSVGRYLVMLEKKKSRGKHEVL